MQEYYLEAENHVKCLLLILAGIISLSNGEWTGKKMQNKVRLTFKMIEIAVNMRRMKHFLV